ncbi:MAG: endonuclease/exonuclease/phosphatase family protein [Kangiellaceae bacterium]|nr:endonuclease/exonuclease/phosphatase family protein [Kangiellaceae bacterium]
MFKQNQRIKLLSYNLQVGIDSHRYRDYVTQSWRHILPDSKRANNLRRAADWLSSYDIVALQEVDAGSLRSQFINQVAYLADQGGFPHYHQQQNRNVAGLAAHSNGMLSKFASSHAIHHKLPGRIPGRGALEVTFGTGSQQVLVLSVHLSLSHNARKLQLKYIAELLKDIPHFVIMGDMNCPTDQVSVEFDKVGLRVKQSGNNSPTFPRWNPKYCFDQIWVSESLNIIKSEVLDLGVSDHRPIAMEIEIPAINDQPSIPRQFLN